MNTLLIKFLTDLLDQHKREKKMNTLVVRDFFEELKDLFLKIIFGFMVMTLYFLFGILLSIPYILLSGGNIRDIVVSASITPIAFLLIVAFWPRKEFLRWRNGRFRNIFTSIFVIFIAYLSIPILLNLISFIFSKMGYKKLSEIIFDLRYISLILLPIGTIMLILLISFVMNLYRKARFSFKNK